MAAESAVKEVEGVSDTTPTEPEENVLNDPDEISDVILEVEGRELHTSRAVLAHYSPVFRAMLYSSFKEKSSEKVPLPGKTYSSMVTFCNVLYPRKVSAKCLIDDSNLMELLTLADEYQTDKVMAACQNYIGDQLCDCFLNFYRYSASRYKLAQEVQQSNCIATASLAFPAQKARRSNRSNATGFSFGSAVSSLQPQQHLMMTEYADKRGQTVTKETMIQKLLLYLWACDAHQLPTFREVVKSLLVDLAVCLKDVARAQHYSSLPHVSRADLAEELCSKLDGSREFPHVSLDKQSLF